MLYERYLGRPFAAHRDAVSELVGEVMENVIFLHPDEVNPVMIIEAKITSDDGTARDKVARIKEMETQRRRPSMVSCFALVK